MGALKLEVFQNGEFMQEVPFDGKDLWVGRDQDCLIRLDDRAISRKHVVLRSTDQGIEFEKKSKFGNVKVNGKDSDQTMLKGGDRLEFAGFEIRVKKDEASVVEVPVSQERLAPEPTEMLPAAPEEAPSAPVIEMSSLEDAPVDFLSPSENNRIEFDSASAPEMANFQEEVKVEPVSSNTRFDFASAQNDGATRVFQSDQGSRIPVLQFNGGAANVTQYELTEGEVAIGRSQKCNVVLGDKKSSRKHSIIRKEGEKFILKDLGSANGTLVNGERVDEHELQSGDVLTIGDTQFTFQWLQADYEKKKEEFISVPQPEPEPIVASLMPDLGLPGFTPMEPGQQFHGMSMQNDLGPKYEPEITPDFVAPEPEKKSFIGKFLDRYRAMNTKQQVIYGVVILAVLYMLLDDEPEKKTAKLNTGDGKAKVVKKADDKKPGSGMSFENLTPEQQRYIENQNQLALDYFKNRDYDSALLEVEKIFSLVQDYKGARTIESLSREGKHRLEAQEEERKKKESEKQAQIKLQGLLEQASLHMEKNQFKEAEALFPEIEILQPENTTVSEWRKRIVAENERLDRENQKKKQMAENNRLAWAEYQKALAIMNSKNYWDALDAFDVVLTRTFEDQKLVDTVNAQIKKAEDAIAADRDPLIAEAKQFEQDGKMAEAYRSYQKAYEVDPTDHESTDGMNRIRGALTGKAKNIYAEGVFAESYGDMDSAEKQYRQVLDVVPNDDEYYSKAQSRLKRLSVLRKPASESVQ